MFDRPSFQTMRELADLLSVLNVLSWDARTQMPSGGNAVRPHHLATVNAVYTQRLTDPALRRQIAIDQKGLDPSSDAFLMLSQLDDAAERLARIPLPLHHEFAQTKAVATAVWQEARPASDFALLRPHLERLVSIKREMAQALGFEDHPYDALLHQYEPGVTLAQLRAIFGVLLPAQAALRERIERCQAPRDDFLHRHYPAERQRQAALSFAQMLGYDLNRGRLDISMHPFEISFTRHDVRITTRYAEDFLPTAFFGVMHEAGHAIYEQGVSEDYTRSAFTSDYLNAYAVGGASFGVHESQSRLWENRVARGRPFWEGQFERLQAFFPLQLRDVDVDEFYRAVNLVRPGLIRVEADELTYDAHVGLRVELEAELLAGTLEVRDLPEAWNSGMQAALGICSPDDRDGVLQDIHWASGQFGTFANYTLGNVMAAQLYDAAQMALPELSTQLRAGECAPLRAWLTEHVYQYGRKFTPNALMLQATGQPIDPAPYLRQLNEKFTDVYRLEA
ncbi:carboxypeptidase M32 [Deinococcus detaillensis]|uniref:carboxypeptidase M32 n=1 Tax=Deinococcus detaillensis TaxID=2592048 RepID=UPI00384E3063